MGKLIYFGAQLLILGAVCYLLSLITDPLDNEGLRIGRMLSLPDEITASTLQALATSGPEIIMAVLSATAFISHSAGWEFLELGERACSGTLNMAFSAINNLLGIGAAAMIWMLRKGVASPDDPFTQSKTVRYGLWLYLIISSAFFMIIRDGVIDVREGWLLMLMGVGFVIVQIHRAINDRKKRFDEINQFFKSAALPQVSGYGVKIKSTKQHVFLDLSKAGAKYVALVFGLLIFTKVALSATFNMAVVGVISVGGVLIGITSYVSSFPELMLSIQYTRYNRGDEMLAMLFGSNIIDLAFAGYRAIHTRRPMAVYTTGAVPGLLKWYILALPVTALALLIGIWTGKLKWKHAYILVAFNLIYIVSGMILL